ncbi:MAG: hypothetical protein C5B49_02230 [Bdellovibrio sp.]|nr:MAG: hypothetical protein C5B49_02230 [Bdellovibrio sp.]
MSGASNCASIRPLAFERSQGLLVTGYGSLLQTSALLQDQRLFAVPVGRQAFYLIAAFNFFHSSVGPFREVFVSVMVSREERRQFGIFNFLRYWAPFGPPQDPVELLLRHWIDGEAVRSLLVSWGGRIEPAKIFLSRESGFKVMGKDGETFLQAQWRDPPAYILPGAGLSFWQVSSAPQATSSRPSAAIQTFLAGRFYTSTTEFTDSLFIDHMGQWDPPDESDHMGRTNRLDLRNPYLRPAQKFLIYQLRGTFDPTFAPPNAACPR